MKGRRVLTGLLMAALAPAAAITGCADSPVDPVDTVPESRMNVALPASSCPFVQLPASAQVVLCFNTTLQSGVWHGFIMEQSDAQPPGTPNYFDRSRLNHHYILASPQGFTEWGPNDPVAPAVVDDVYAFQPEFFLGVWWDVFRIMSATTQATDVVVFWVDASGVGADIETLVADLASAGVLNGGQANALTKKIDQALTLIAQGKVTAAEGVLDGFIQQVNDLTYVDFVLSPAEGDELVAWATYLLQSI